jgi:copper chaperone CopZ
MNLNTFGKSLFPMILMLLSGALYAQAPIKHAVTETVHVYGNCGMCKTTIEKSAFKKGVAEAEWNKSTKMATITYDSTKTSVKEVLKRIADAGYDNDLYTAPEEAYNNLHACCQYERKPQ